MTGDQVELNAFERDEEEKVRLKYLAEINPYKSEVSDLPSDTDVSFVPLEGFGTTGSIESSEVKSLEEVYNGYTYFKEGDIAIAKITPSFENGKGAICKGLVNGIGFGTTELHILRPHPTTNTEFLWYALRAKPFMDEAEAAMRGVAGQQRVPSEFLENYRTHNFQPQKQQEIASYLNHHITRTDRLIRKKSELIELLDEKRSAYLTQIATGKLLENPDLKTTSVECLEEIPAHWDTVRMKFLVDEIEQGWSPKCEDRPANTNEWGVLKAGAVNNGVFHEDENKALPGNESPKPEYEINQGDLIMNRASGSSDLIGSVAVVPEVCSKLLLCDKLYRLHVRENVANSEYLYNALRSKPLRYQIVRAISGAGGLANNIPQGDVKELVIPVPPLSEQKSIAQTTRKWESKLDSLIRKTTRAIELLREKRQALITKAVTGQIDVTDWEPPKEQEIEA